MTAYDELELDTLGDQKTALFLIMSDTDDSFNFLISMCYTQLFNLLCEKADDVYGGRLPVHVRCLIDECANIGQIPKLEKLMATIRSREISACLVLQAQSQLKAIYKDNADTIIGNCDCSIFLGGKEPTTLKELSAVLGKETVDTYNTGESRGRETSHSLNYQKLGKDIHNHIIWNSVNLDCDRKFRNFWGSTRAVRRLNDTICIENGYSIVENPKHHGKSYNKWLGDQAKPSHRELLRVAIDNALSQKPADWDALLKLLQEAGYEIKPSKNPSFRCEGWGRSVRLDTLGENYSKDVLLSVIKGEKRHTPRKKKQIDQEPKRVNLLVDIQAKLQEGKGAGYARWARSFNLKQLAQTMNYLTDHGLLEYAALADKAAAATARHNELSAQIKAAEKRMAEIAVLRAHIINYSKTREVYVVYRKAGYSKKFLAEHEADILLHKAAKKAFDELGLKNIPTVKSLQAEYAQLLEEKKKAYGEFRQARDEMRELLTVKANVDRLLGTEEQEAGQEKEHDLR